MVTNEQPDSVKALTNPSAKKPHKNNLMPVAKPTNIPSASSSKMSGNYKIFVMDGTELDLQVDKNAKGQDLFEKVVQTLSLLEKDYFGLSHFDSSRCKVWLENGKKVRNQLSKCQNELLFEVKFYPPEPDQLQEDITRYYLCHQVRNDVVSGKLACSPLTQALLGSYIVQAQLGDYDPDHNGPPEEYLSDFKFAPQHSQDVLDKVHELHKLHKGQKPNEAELNCLQNAKKLAFYGVDPYPAKDTDNADVSVAVCSSGVLVYRDMLRINRLAWPKILKISYRLNQFYVKMRRGEFEQRETVIGFKFPTTTAAKSFWQRCVENHAFFRLMSPDPMNKRGLFFGLGSTPKFRFSGRTLYQSKLASGIIHRPPPSFQRSTSSRFPVKIAVESAPMNISVEYKPADLSSPLKFVDSSSKDPSRQKPAPPSTLSVIHSLQYDSSPDELMIVHQPSPSVAPAVRPPTDSVVMHQYVPSSGTSRSSGDTSATTASSADAAKRPPTQPSTPLEVIQIPVAIQRSPEDSERQVNVPITVTQEPLDKKMTEKEQRKADKTRAKFAKAEAKQRQKVLKAGAPKVTVAAAAPSCSVPIVFGTERLGDFYRLTVIPVSSAASVGGSHVTVLKRPISSDEIQAGHGAIIVPPSETSVKSPDRTSVAILQLEQSGTSDGGIYLNGEEDVFRPTETPLNMSPKQSPKVTTTVLTTNEESVHNVPTQVMTVRGLDGSLSKTTTASQIKTIKQTVQTKSYETYTVPASTLTNSSPAFTPDIFKHSTANQEILKVTNTSFDSAPPIAVPASAKCINVERRTDGNKIIETVTYQLEKDGVTETRTEHRVTLAPEADIDYEEALTSAILKATKMNPKLTVEKVEVRRCNGSEV